MWRILLIDTQCVYAMRVVHWARQLSVQSIEFELRFNFTLKASLNINKLISILKLLINCLLIIFI